MKKTMRRLVVCAGFAFVYSANADVTIDIVEAGGDVNVTLRGSIDLDRLGSQVDTAGGYNGYLASGGQISMNFAPVDFYNIGGADWTPFGSGGFGNWDVSGGDGWAMYGNPFLGIPVGYVSGTALNATASAVGTDFATLGFDLGSYVTTLVGGRGSQTVTVNVLPAPGSLALLGLAGVVGIRRRR